MARRMMDLKDITTGPVASVAELIDLSEGLVPAPQGAAGGGWAFRGQPRDYGTLTPSFQRQFPRHSYGTAERIERRLIEAFRLHYAELKDRSADMPPPDSLRNGYDLRCLSVMQHYEIPTRLLDWTSNFWTAIYFACASEPGFNAELWCYDRHIFDAQRQHPLQSALFDGSLNPRLEPTVLGLRGEPEVLELDPRITPRMQQQLAHHTVSTDVFADHAPLIFARQHTLDGAPPGLLRRIIIDGSCKSKALQFLADEMDITASTIFPDVVGLGRFLRWQFDSLRTMLM
jgi:hypothetical protein